MLATLSSFPLSGLCCLCFSLLEMCDYAGKADIKKQKNFRRVFFVCSHLASVNCCIWDVANWITDETTFYSDFPVEINLPRSIAMVAFITDLACFWVNTNDQALGLVLALTSSVNESKMLISNFMKAFLPPRFFNQQREKTGTFKRLILEIDKMDKFGSAVRAVMASGLSFASWCH